MQKHLSIRNALSILILSGIVFPLLVGGGPVQAAGGPAIGNWTTNVGAYSGGKVPRFEKFELTFDVNTVAENPNFPYDPNPPAGIEPGQGVTINAILTPDNWSTTFVQPAFLYQPFETAIKGGKDWLYPQGDPVWKVRFAPNIAGLWRFKLTAQDASGFSESAAGSFEVVDTGERGFLRVSERDPRYFEYDNGDYFPSLGYNLNARNLDWVNPSSNEADFQAMNQNGIQLTRFWLSQWSVFGSAWSPWKSHNPAHQSQEPYAGLRHDSGPPFNLGPSDPPIAREGSDVFLWLNQDETVFSDGKQWLWTPCVVMGWEAPSLPVKRNATYRVRIRYKTEGLTGPDVAGKPFGFAAKYGGWMWPNDESERCYAPGTGTVVAATYGGGNWSSSPDPEYASWSILEGTFNSGSQDFLDKFYLAVENATGGSVYVDYIWIEEVLSGGNYGANVVNKPWVAQHQYFDQRNSYAMDMVVELAEQYDIYLKPVVLEKQDYALNIFEFDGSTIDTMPAQYAKDLFFGNGRETSGKTKTRWLMQAWWRYLQARWGYSTSIHSWELLNEGNPGDPLHHILTDEMGKYFRKTFIPAGQATEHPNMHMVSTSFWSQFKNEFWSSANYPYVDYADVHEYAKESGPGALGYIYTASDFYDAALYTQKLSMYHGALQPNGPRKPVIRGEIGWLFDGTDLFNQNADNGTWLHNLIWGGINAGGVIEHYWVGAPTQAHIYNGSHDHRPSFRSYYNFIQDVPLNNGLYRDAQAGVSGTDLRAWGQIDPVNGRAHLWIQNSQHTWKKVADGASIPTRSGTITVGGFQAGERYRLEWWDTYQTNPATQITATETLTANGSGVLTIQVSNLNTDVALKIEPENPIPTGTFADVPQTHPYYQEIEALYAAGYTSGCAEAPLRYCPDQPMNRAESSVYVLRGVHGVDLQPAQPGSQRFADLELDSWAAKWADRLFADGYSAGCGADPLSYCPWQGHTRVEGAVFYLRMLNGVAYEPPAPGAIFSDMTSDYWGTKWAEAAYNAGLIPACNQQPLRFCADGPLTRGLAAYMMVQAKGLAP